MEQLGFVTVLTQVLETMYIVIEWAFRAFGILATLLQFMIRNSHTGRFCIHDAKVLAVEGECLRWLIIIQSIKIVVLSVWHLILNRAKQSFFLDQTDTSYFSQRSSG